MTGWLRRLFHGSHEERRLDSELRFHLDQQAADYVAEGMSPADARRRARLEFGGIERIKEECRESRRGYVLETLARDVRHAIRALGKSPGFTVSALVTLALGIGANTAIFSVVDTLLLRPLPVRDPGALVFLSFPRDANHFDADFSTPEFLDIRDRTHEIFANLQAARFGGRATGRSNGLTVDSVTRPAQMMFVTGAFFDMLGIRPHVGRLLLPGEGASPGADPVVVLSYRYWQTRFRGDPSVVGKAALVNGTPVTIVGVAPSGFFGPTPLVDMEAYLPLGMAAVESGSTAFMTDPAARNLLLIGRLADGVTRERANAILAAVGPPLIRQYRRPGVTPALQARRLRPPGLLNGPNPFPALAAVFLTLAALVLALACLNVANLSLVRVSERGRELAIRAALGGSRARLVGYLMTETAILAAGGAVAGSIVGAMALGLLASAVSAVDVPIVLEFPFNARVFSFALATATVSAFLVGLLPAVRATGGALSGVLASSGRGTTTSRQRTRTVLVALQIAGSLALLIAAGLFVRSLQRAQNVDLGFDPADVMNVRLDPGEIGFNAAQTASFYRQLLERVRALPGIEHAALTTLVPLASDMAAHPDTEIVVAGYEPAAGERVHANDVAISTEYFETLGMTLLHGRGFTDADTVDAARVAVINETMADRYWHGVESIGRTFILGRDPNHPIHVVGVVRNSRIEDPFSPYEPWFFSPLSQQPAFGTTLQIRTKRAPESIASNVLAIVRGLAPTAPVLSVRTMSDTIQTSLDGLLLFRIGAQLTGALGVSGLLLAVVGVYGVMAYAVGQRTREIGVRVALGAPPRSILWIVARHAATIIAVGLGLGLLAAVGIGKLVATFLLATSPTDTLTYATMGAVLALSATVAAYVPTRRAMRVDPIVALRSE